MRYNSPVRIVMFFWMFMTGVLGLLIIALRYSGFLIQPFSLDPNDVAVLIILMVVGGLVFISEVKEKVKE